MSRTQRVLWLIVGTFCACLELRAQDVDARRYAVAYVDVRPAASGRAVEAFGEYRDQIRREDGFIAIDLGEQVGRPGHSAIVETWRGQTAVDQHQRAAPLTQSTTGLHSIRTSGYEQRPCKTVAAAAPRGTAGRNAVTVVSHVDIGGGAKIDVPALLRKLSEASRAEAGSIRFDVVQHTVRANHFTVIETWDSQ